MAAASKARRAASSARVHAHAQGFGLVQGTFQGLRRTRIQRRGIVSEDDVLAGARHNLSQALTCPVRCRFGGKGMTQAGFVPLIKLTSQAGCIS